MGSEAERESSGWQGKLNTKRRKCNKARMLTNAFYLKRKANYCVESGSMIQHDCLQSVSVCLQAIDFMHDKEISVLLKSLIVKSSV